MKTQYHRPIHSVGLWGRDATVFFFFFFFFWGGGGGGVSCWADSKFWKRKVGQGVLTFRSPKRRLGPPRCPHPYPSI